MQALLRVCIGLYYEPKAKETSASHGGFVQWQRICVTCKGNLFYILITCKWRWCDLYLRFRRPQLSLHSFRHAYVGTSGGSSAGLGLRISPFPMMSGLPCRAWGCVLHPRRRGVSPTLTARAQRGVPCMPTSRTYTEWEELGGLSFIKLPSAVPGCEPLRRCL